MTFSLNDLHCHCYCQKKQLINYKFQIYYSLFLFSLDGVESHAIVLFLVLLNQKSLKSKSVRKSVRNRMNLETMSWMKNTSHKMASNGQEC